MKKIKNLSLLFFAFSILKIASAQNINLTLSSHLSYGTDDLSNIWGWVDTADGKEYALVGYEFGVSIVDVSAPASPVLIVNIPGPQSIWREIKTIGDYAYVTTENGAIGLQIIELTNLPATNLNVATWTPVIGTDTLKTIHALHAENGKVYLYGGNLQGCTVADVSSTPMAPVYLGSYNSGGYIHDGYVQGDTMYAAHIWAGQVEIVDMTNPAAGISLASFQTPNSFTHNTWLSSDSKTCFATDEVNGSFLSAFDISDLSNISELDRIQSNPGDSSIVHNTYIIKKGGVDYAVTSWYKDGITVVDASRPNNLVQVGNYDSSPLSGKGYGGCWGVYPYLPSGTVLLSDIDSGLYVLAPTYVRGCYLEGVVVDCITTNPVLGALVEIMNAPSSLGSSTDLTDGFGKYEVGVLAPGTYTVMISKSGFLTQTVTATVSTGNVTTLPVQLCAVGINEYPYSSQVSAFPNPFTLGTTISLETSLSGSQNLQLNLFDIIGEKMYSYSSRSGSFTIDRGNLASGMYFYQILDGDRILAAGKLCAE